MESEEGRALTLTEQTLLDQLLAHDFDGVGALRAQATAVLAKVGCRCGCGTIDLLPQGADIPLSGANSPVEVEGRVVDDSGQDIGGLLVFLNDGQLASLEVYSVEDPLPLPDSENVIWSAVSRRS